MPTLTIYEQQDFPSVYNWQAIAFMRCEWPSIFQGDILYLPAPYPPELNPVHFVMAEGESLLSYATLMKLNLSHAGQDFAVYGFGNMLTFPPYRKQGYGRTILHAAAEFIQKSARVPWMSPSCSVIKALKNIMLQKDGWQLIVPPTLATPGNPCFMNHYV